ncbi:MAG TPA: cytochrome c3 family protein [Anaeromyxobacteraceae bacterium]|nr:cytochrome c3 family protein [Anaeromyxobacteraceae bacterium]
MKVLRALVLVLVCAPVSALAAGGHDSVGCSGCHSIHSAKGAIIFAVPANKASVNPKTQKPYTGSTALCLGCHEDASKGGQGYAPVSGHLSHPYGVTTVNPKVASVPPELLRNGSFECVSCHDPHMSNPNKSYLRVDIGAKGEKMDAFCAVCHSVKADPSMAPAKFTVFTSMDESRRPAAPAAPAKK